MAEPEIEQAVANDTTPPLLEQLSKAFLELEARKDGSVEKVQWMEIEEHFRNLETLLKKKSEELESREREFEEKEAETCALLAEREAAVFAKEQDLLDRVQELKDAAVAAIAEARANHEPTSSEPVDAADNQNGQVSSYLGVTNSPEEDLPYKSAEDAEGGCVVVKPRPELMQFCEQMDAKGLMNFITENPKSQHAIREELSVALESATEPAQLVLDSLEGFYPSDETTEPGSNEDAALQGMHKSCVIFMGAMATLLARVDPGGDDLLNPETKQNAMAIAIEWKTRLDTRRIVAANGNTLETEAFLQLLVTFRIGSEFVEEELLELILTVAHRRQAPELCRSLGLTHKIPGIVEHLIHNGKQIDAVHFIHAFQLTESFPLVPLLKTYLKDLRRNSQGKGGNTEGAAGAQNDANAQELAALKAVIRCVEEYKLDADYPLIPLQKRVTQLERSKADKRSGEFGKRQQQKKPRTNGGYYGFRAPVIAASGRQAPPVFGGRAPPPFTGTPESFPRPGYQVPPTQSAYAQQANEQRLYYYPQDDRAMSYNTGPSAYGSYSGGGLQSSHQPYM